VIGTIGQPRRIVRSAQDSISSSPAHSEIRVVLQNLPSTDTDRHGRRRSMAELLLSRTRGRGTIAESGKGDPATRLYGSEYDPGAAASAMSSAAHLKVRVNRNGPINDLRVPRPLLTLEEVFEGNLADKCVLCLKPAIRLGMRRKAVTRRLEIRFPKPIRTSATDHMAEGGPGGVGIAVESRACGPLR
jgi:hypothetical protein